MTARKLVTALLLAGTVGAMPATATPIGANTGREGVLVLTAGPASHQLTASCGYTYEPYSPGAYYTAVIVAAAEASGTADGSETAVTCLVSAWGRVFGGATRRAPGSSVVAVGAARDFGDVTVCLAASTRFVDGVAVDIPLTCQPPA